MAVKVKGLIKKTLADLLAGVTPSNHLRLFSNKRRCSAVKVKTNDGEYSRGAMICKADIRCLNIILTESKTAAIQLFCLLLAFLPLHHDIELDLLVLDLLFNFLLFLLIYDCGK